MARNGIVQKRGDIPIHQLEEQLDAIVEKWTTAIDKHLVEDFRTVKEELTADNATSSKFDKWLYIST